MSDKPTSHRETFDLTRTDGGQPTTLHYILSFALILRLKLAFGYFIETVSPSALPPTALPNDEVMWVTPDAHLQKKTVAPSAGAFLSARSAR